MFDARSILDMLVRRRTAPTIGIGTRTRRRRLQRPDSASSVASPASSVATSAAAAGRIPTATRRPYRGAGYEDDRRDAPPAQDGQSLEDLLRSVLGGGEQPEQAPRGGAAKQRRPWRRRPEDFRRATFWVAASKRAGPGGGAQRAPGGGNEDMLRDLLGGGPGGTMNRMVGDGGGQGNVLDILKQVLGQATSGVREGAGRLDEATGASGRARDAIGQATGQSPDELIAKLKDLIASNKSVAGAALGGLGNL